MHWTDHYVEYGYAVIPGAVDANFVKAAQAEAERIVNSNLPPDQWTTENLGGKRNVPYDAAAGNMLVLPQVYDQPGFRNIIDTMFGSPEQWIGDRKFILFVSPYDPAAKQTIADNGHLDFVNCPIPTLGSGFMFQVVLRDNEPFSGNITIYPGTHKHVQRIVMEDPKMQYPPIIAKLPKVKPFEFVGKAGDVMIFHHIVLHEGNANHAANRSPRMVIHGQALRKTWLEAIDPAAPDLSPWERSLAHNGRWRPPQNEQIMMETHYAERRAKSA